MNRKPSFQLHTVHQEHYGGIIWKVCLFVFQLHTVHQEQKGTLNVVPCEKNELSTPHGTLGTAMKQQAAQQAFLTFNSTRYIRNGSLAVWIVSNLRLPAFNSTRYIRNYLLKYLVKSHHKYLSTPHGTLGTSLSCSFIALVSIFQLHTVHQELAKKLKRSRTYILSTPHGTLGTTYLLNTPTFTKYPFNSTRYIRNFQRDQSVFSEVFSLSTPHGTLGTLFCANAPLPVREVFQLHTVHQELKIR